VANTLALSEPSRKGHDVGLNLFPALPLERRKRNSRERRNRLCRAARGRPLGGSERKRAWG